MIALDTNALVHAHRPDAPLHAPAATLLRGLVEGTATWALPWPCLHEFYAVVTNPKVWADPTPTARAWEQLTAWLDSPSVVLLSEARDHATQLHALTRAARTTGAQVHDARIAAICLSHGVSELITLDRDFSRFPQLRTRGLPAEA